MNAALRSVRRAAGLSLDVLAARMNFSKSYLSNVEAGRRRVTVEIARAYDAAVGTGGLLTRLLAGEPDAPVGRASELATLHRYAAELSEGRGAVVWVEGEPGIGKSTLLRAGLTGTLGYRTLWATADMSLGRFPLRALLDQLAVEERAEITALLGDGSVGLAAGDAIIAAAERLIMLVERWCASSPVLVVLDDMQWADEMSLSVWGRLRRLADQLPLLLAGACRPVPRRPEVAELRRAVSGSDGAVLVLAPLSDDDVTRLTERLAGAPAGPQLRAAAQHAGGNPLYLRELVDALRREHRIHVADGRAEFTTPDDGVVPRSLAEAIGTRLDFLSDRTRTVLRLAAALEPELTVEELSAVTGQPATELADILDEAIAAGVLTATSDRMAFRHGLIRAALYEQTPPALRIALHRQAARALAETGTSVEAVAGHLLASGAETESWVAGWLAGGAAAALATRAPHAALELIDRVPGRGDLAGYRIAVLSLLGRDAEVIRQAPAVLADGTDPEIAARTAWALAYSLGRRGRLTDGRAVIRETLGRYPVDSTWRARLYACDAVLARDHDVSALAVAEAERAGDRFALGYALHSHVMAYWRGEPDEEAGLACIDRALDAIGDRPETADLRVMLLGNRALSLLNLSRAAEVPQALGRALEAAERHGAVQRLIGVRSCAVGVYYHYGRWDDALAELSALAELPPAGAERQSLNVGTAALIAVHRDDHAGLAAHLATLSDDEATDDLADMLGEVRVARALALESSGRTGEAAAAILVAGLRRGSTPLDPQILLDCQSYLPDIVRLALATGHRAQAQAYTDAVVSRAHGGTADVAAVAWHCQGLLAEDPDLVAAAAERYTFVLDRAQACENLAVLLAGRGDTRGARSAYEAATATYAQLEAAWDLRRAEARLRPLGLGPSPHRIRRRPAAGWDALTPTELKVAALVADGLSNPHIAAELHVSRRTVETHVAHILTKLGGRSRNHIATTRPA